MMLIEDCDPMNSTCRVLDMVEEVQDPRVMGQAVSLPVTRCGGGDLATE